MEENNFRVCKRCLTRDLMGQQDQFKTIREYIDNLDEDLKTPESEYEDRLAICKECDMLLTGMCRSCGCYVEMRAALRKNNCPRKKW